MTCSESCGWTPQAVLVSSHLLTKVVCPTIDGQLGGSFLGSLSACGRFMASLEVDSIHLRFLFFALYHKCRLGAITPLAGNHSLPPHRASSDLKSHHCETSASGRMKTSERYLLERVSLSQAAARASVAQLICYGA